MPEVVLWSKSLVFISLFACFQSCSNSLLTNWVTILGLEVVSSLCFSTLVTNKIDVQSEMVLSNNSEGSSDETLCTSSRYPGVSPTVICCILCMFFMCHCISWLLASFSTWLPTSPVSPIRCLTLFFEMRNNTCPLCKFQIILRHIESPSSPAWVPV